MTRARLVSIVLLAVVAVGLILGAALWTRQRRDMPSISPTATPPVAGYGRIRVQVLNATRVRGLARHATLFLRDRGFDVVEVGTTTPRESTLVVDRSNHPGYAQRVAQALGGTPPVELRPDTSRYLDVTVLLGASWRPPPGPFYP